MRRAPLVMAGLGALLGAVFRHASFRFKVQDKPLAERIDAILPQTQCRLCGFPGCRPYAEAIASGAADINQCPPGGADGVRRIAVLLGIEPKPLNTAHGEPKPRSLAIIDERLCIGCTLCIQACPVDAIIGAPKQMHTVLAAACTGCELCVAPCPVDCITMQPIAERVEDRERKRRRREKEAADASRKRYAFHLFRLEREKQEKVAKRAMAATPIAGENSASTDRKLAAVQAAIERARAKQVAAAIAEARKER